MNIRPPIGEEYVGSENLARMGIQLWKAPTDLFNSLIVLVKPFFAKHANEIVESAGESVTQKHTNLGMIEVTLVAENAIYSNDPT